MKKRFNGRLPQQNLKTKLKFEEPVFCSLKASMTGKTQENSTDAEKEALSLTECTHEQWPTFWPHCIGCLAHNKYDRYLTDKKGRDYKVVSVGEQQTPIDVEGLKSIARQFLRDSEVIKDAVDEPGK